MEESLNRVAWTQYRNTPHQGMGSGLRAFNDKQQHGRYKLEKDYYIKSKGRT